MRACLKFLNAVKIKRAVVPTNEMACLDEVYNLELSLLWLLLLS